MNLIDVITPSRTYQVHMGRDLLCRIGEITRAAAGGIHAMLISDSHVMPLYGAEVQRSLEGAGYDVACATIPAGEQSKNMAQLSELLEDMAAHGLSRDDVVVALGGGVVGDLAGFAAACYMRGISIVQVPTSLLAMVDSSVGGKTAVDLAAGKNLAGAFWQPAAVVADVACLHTLSPELFCDSVGEIIKCGVLCDPDLFASLEDQPLTLDDLQRVEESVIRCIEIKRDVVAADEREEGLRQTLNLGHTIGHAIEAESAYRLGHGACVAAGLCCMARADAALGVCSQEVARRIETVVASHGLPIRTSLSCGILFQRSLADKKRHGETVHVVSIRDIGCVEVETISLDQYRRLLELGCEG